MDKNWCHQFLKGAVSQGLKIEDKWGSIIPEIGLAKKATTTPNF